MIRPRQIALLCAILLGGTARPAAAHEWFAPEPPLLSLSIGAAQIFDEHPRAFWSIEYRPAFRCLQLGPWLFFGTGRDREFYAAAGVLMDLRLGPKWVLTPSFGGGYYNAEHGLDLGFDMQFRTALELARRFGRGYRIGVGLSHLSNGSLNDKNPGTETLHLSLSIPLDALFRRRPLPAAAPPPE